MHGSLSAVIAAASLCLTWIAQAEGTVVIPAPVQGKSRLITVADVAGVRKVGSLSVSPDGRRFTVFVTQGDAIENAYRTGWFVGDVGGKSLMSLGSGGHVRYSVRPTGLITGDIEKRESRWSRDGQWIAYLRRGDDGFQLWRSNVRTGAQEQLTKNAGDVRDFEWSEDGRAIFFKAGTARSELAEKERARARLGYRYDQDLITFSELMGPERRIPPEKDLNTWIVTVEDRQERLASEGERGAFDRVRGRNAGGKETDTGFKMDAAVPPVLSRDGAAAWLTRSKSGSTHLRVMSQSSPEGAAVACDAPVCLGRIERVWWSEDGERIFFWRHEGVNDLAEHAFYAWSPAAGTIKQIVRTDDNLRFCAPGAQDRLFCARDTMTRPSHVVTIDMTNGGVSVVADLNPEFATIRLGKAERVEWDTPKLAWNEPGGQLEGLYPKRASGYILYPPDFDPKKKYPVFIEPYVALGFNSSGGGEHALQVYAANGIVVLNLAFPSATEAGARLGATVMQQGYSQALDFPHLTMLMESTVRGLDTAIAKGFVDVNRVGIGGVSHGTFVPLYLMQKHDRIAAISISSPHWGPHEYYWGTAASEKATRETYGTLGYQEWRPKPEGEGREFWSRIDIADHVDQIEGPVLMHLAAGETYPLLRLIRHLRDAQRPYDAYVFDKETHLKWQPAHLHTIMTRNLEWFRFWLQDVEDPDPSKAEQYTRWRLLREQQCRNPRSLRDYCRVVSRSAPPAPG